ncbi:PREDICTED: transcription factor UNE10-like [Nelumbo nucifera]|uniref:Transcription factor UNE10-like n=2 Tax=Nelumbo nucifera TaxID=4432 RepID=A0A1U8AFB5_NELNU|nr:PREDICTED: transcription factor UNE10-like [Nelumbo nucifera]DAD18493.1 TPA_asm: hypothetical protein HUJ06_019956 [Nelumbo nucifera]
MNQCVPRCDLDETPTPAGLTTHPHSNSDSAATDVSMLNTEVVELTWENGQVALHGLGPNRPIGKPLPSTTTTTSKYTWEKPRAGGTLESIVSQATRLDPSKVPLTGGDDLVPWFYPHGTIAAQPITMDALVPCANRTTSTDDQSNHVPEPNSLRPESSGEAGTVERRTKEVALTKKLARKALVPVTHERSSKQSVSISATFGRDSSRHDMSLIDTYELDPDTGFTSNSLGSPENTSTGKPSGSYNKPTTVDDHDSVCHSGSQREPTGLDEDNKKKSFTSSKRSRAAEIHNESERKRRDKINQKLKTLQKLVPNSSKTDKASMLDEVIEYLKQLQAQVQMMSRMSMPHMMLPMAMQQQFQMSMLAQMGMTMGMNMGMGMMDINSIARPNITGIPPVVPSGVFMPLSSWDNNSADRLPSSCSIMPDPLTTFLSCQSKPITMDSYSSRMAALYQQLHQSAASNSKS